jgi:uncharacterized protein YecE (DUF72 family)
MKALPGQYFSGTSGLVLPVPNKLAYPAQYQDKPRLTYYASLFNSIEVNSSFYKVPQAATVKKWADSVPDNFKFTFKLWRGITHNKGFVYDAMDIAKFIAVINSAGAKNGNLLIQFPPSIKADCLIQLEKLLLDLSHVRPGQSGYTSVEFRHSSWYNTNTYQLLKRYDVGLVLHDMPKSATPMVITNDSLIYLRFHGPAGDYRGGYTDSFLGEYTTYIKDWLAEGKTVYAYFNNTMGAAVHNLATLNQYVAE